MSNPFKGFAIMVLLLAAFILTPIGVTIWVSKKIGARTIRDRENNPKAIVFAGRISQPNNRRWLNNRLVLIYVQDMEIGRAQSQTSAFRETVERPTDGVFSIAVDNTYGVSMKELSACQTKELGYKTVYCWLGEFSEDSNGTTFGIPERKVQFSVRILPGDYETLPEEMKEAGTTAIVDGNIVVVSSRQQPQGLIAKLLNRFSGHPDQQSLEKRPNLIESVTYNPNPETIDLPLEAQTTSLDNCAGSDTLRQTITDSKTFVREVTVQLTGNLRVPLETVELQLGSQGGYRQKQITTRNISYDLSAKPGTDVLYKIRWEEVWRRGVVAVREDNGVVKLPFRLREKVDYSIKPETLPCKKVH